MIECGLTKDRSRYKSGRGFFENYRAHPLRQQRAYRLVESRVSDHRDWKEQKPNPIYRDASRTTVGELF